MIIKTDNADNILVTTMKHCVDLLGEIVHYLELVLDDDSTFLITVTGQIMDTIIIFWASFQQILGTTAILIAVIIINAVIFLFLLLFIGIITNVVTTTTIVVVVYILINICSSGFNSNRISIIIYI